MCMLKKTPKKHLTYTHISFIWFLSKERINGGGGGGGGLEYCILIWKLKTS